MEFITMTPEEFADLLKQLSEIKLELVNLKKKTALSDIWLDNQDVCQQLKISKRLLQSWRDDGRIEFAQHNAKIWYRASEINSFLEANIVKKFKK
jgi:hypothetical protein